MTVDRARRLIQMWRSEGLDPWQTLQESYTRRSYLPNGDGYRVLTADGMVIKTELLRQEEVRAMLEAAEHFANVD